MTEQLDELLKIKYESLVMLKERGYIIPSDEASILDQKIKIKDFKNKYANLQNDTSNPFYEYFFNNPIRVSLSNIYYKDSKKCLVYFAESVSGDKKISDSSVSKFCQLIINFDVNEAILISAAPISGAVESLCYDVRKKESDKLGVFIQFFEDKEMKYNPMIHDLVPKHRILSSKEVEYLKNEDKIELNKMPQISSYDPICKRLGAKSENIIEVLRKVIIKDCLIDEELSYRYVFTPAITKKK
jgi:DNA-directed RNA polymerase subunit H